MVRQQLAFWGATAAFMTVMVGSGAPSVFLADYQARWHFPTADLSVAFAVYALTLVAVLLVAAAISNRIGRRLSALGALALTVVAMLIFLGAHDIGSLVAARAVQGAGTALATTVFSTSIAELATQRLRRPAEVIIAITTAGGLGIGVVVAGTSHMVSSTPEALVFIAVIVAVVLASAAIAIGPETVPRKTTSRAPSSTLGGGGRTTGFVKLAPATVAIWMSAGLVLGLGASLSRSTLHLGNGIGAAIVVAAQPLTATICTIVVAPRVPVRALVPAGLMSVMIGVTAEAAAFAASNALLEVGGAIITGLGFGAVFSGTLRTLLPAVATTNRARFFAAFYLTGYLAYGGSAVAAGLLSDRVGLNAAAITYAVATVLIAAIALIVQQRRTAADTAAVPNMPSKTHT